MVHRSSTQTVALRPDFALPTRLGLHDAKQASEIRLVFLPVQISVLNHQHE